MWTVKTLCRNNGYFLCFLFFWRVVSCDCPDGAHKCLKTGVVAHTTFRWVPYFFRVFCPGVVAQCSYAPHKKGQKVRDTNYTRTLLEQAKHMRQRRNGITSIRSSSFYFSKPNERHQDPPRVHSRLPTRLVWFTTTPNIGQEENNLESDGRGVLNC